MKTILAFRTFTAAFTLAFVLIIGCDDSKPTKGNLVGTWEQICDANLPKKESTSEAGLELFKDGTGVIQEGKTSVSIKWELRDGNRLQLDAGGFYGTRIYEAELSEKGKVLALNYDGGIELLIKKGEREGIAPTNPPFTFTDSRDGKQYKAVKIGNQTWMAENLNFDAKDSKICETQDNCRKGSVCYDDKPENCEKYGRLYIHWTAMVICPEGWHLPTNEEWAVLNNNINGSYRCADISSKYNSHKRTEGKHLKAKEGWEKDGNGVDTYGFAGLPGGYGDYVSEGYTRVEREGSWWSATDYQNAANYHAMSSNADNSYKSSEYKGYLHNVRCVKDSTDAKAQKPAEVKEEPAKQTETVVEEKKQSATFTDSRDNKTYKTVKIGTQNWIAENLNYNANGSKCYDNEQEKCDRHGRLYNWATAKIVCPVGWHLPSDNEWSILINFVDGTGGSTGRDSPNAGKLLKAAKGWEEDGNGTDEFGFAALPSGYGSSNGTFDDIGKIGNWWNATENNADNAYYRSMYQSGEQVRWRSNNKSLLRSVRCIEDSN